MDQVADQTTQDPEIYPDSAVGQFQELIEQEEKVFADLASSRREAARPGLAPKPPPPAGKVYASPGIAEEPWVQSSDVDRVGLALSGGGIRSATFNLGILQGLNDRGVLGKLDYLSTVSGGGYIGGFWTRWRSEERKKARKNVATPGQEIVTGFPESLGNKDAREHGAIRHLREFSSFLIPRRGLIKWETWAPVVHVMAGLVPSLLLAFSMLALFVSAFGLTADLLTVSMPPTVSAWPLAGMPPSSAIAFFLILMSGWFLGWELTEYLFLRGRGGFDRRSLAARFVFTLTAIGLTAAAWTGIRIGLAQPDFAHYPVALGQITAEVVATTNTPAAGKALVVSTNAVANSINALTAAVDTLAAASAPKSTSGSLGSVLSQFKPNLRLLAPTAGILVAAIGMVVIRMLLARALKIGWAIWLLCGLGRLLAIPLRLRSRRGEEKDMDLPEWVRSAAFTACLDRSLVRVVMAGLLWFVMAAIWETGCLLLQILPHFFEGKARMGLGAGGSTAVLTGLFALLRHWLAMPHTTPGRSNWLEKLKPRVPAVLANLVVLLVLLWITTGMLHWGLTATHDVGLFWFRITGGVCAATILLLLLAFDPASVGLHEFYRARITRAFLGAFKSAEGDNATNRATAEEPGDDMYLAHDKGRPVHLICCAANDQMGDQLGNLHRGSRSAVLSRFGVSLAGFNRPMPHLRLSSAVTASAAAINPMMGDISMRLGPAVSFLLAALNMRLGLWAPHPYPSEPERRWKWFPGVALFREMFGLVWARVDAFHGNIRVPRICRELFSAIHLSDGAHFENLGLYELIRRHCRYIIVSDCTADVEVAFDDLSNAIRRVREDFGVEIEIDVDPLRPRECGMAKQHMVTGIVHYDGYGGLDKGTILYFKPALTGDEPPDVRQYRQRNASFPHENTEDQFYDAAQWESYRRLGEHAVRASFQFLNGTKREDLVIEQMFRQARRYSQTMAWSHGPVYYELSNRCLQLEHTLRENAPSTLVTGAFPDVTSVPNAQADPVKAGQEANLMLHLIHVIQVMEEVWQTCELEIHWSHPLARGWMNYLHRWAGTPALRRWWPLLRPLFNGDFAFFAENHLNLPSLKSALSNSLAVVPYDTQVEQEGYRQGLAWQRASELGHPIVSAVLQPARDFTLFGLELTLAGPPAGEGAAARIQVALLVVSFSPDGAQAGWPAKHLFVFPGLAGGGGFTGQLLNGVISELRQGSFQERPPVKSILVALHEEKTPAEAHTLSPAKRMELVELVDCYKSRGFKSIVPSRPESGPCPKSHSLLLDLTACDR